ncbi:MAG: Lrp/AsnC family transcriptional regulator [Rhizobiales bacterium]|nr:Lrp/AsnC family transcriptional regulator [Hyphomicrobiales bacterium]
MTATTRTFLVFVKCELGKTYQVAADLADLEQSPQVYSVSGEYDLFCIFRLPSDDDVGRFICDRVQTIKGVAATNTLVCFNPFTGDRGFS